MDECDVVMDIMASAQTGTFWELRAARLAGTAEGEIAAHQADQFAQMLTVEAIYEPAPERDLSMLS